MKTNKEIVRIFDNFRCYSEPNDYIVFFKYGFARSVLSFDKETHSFLNGRLLEYAKVYPIIPRTDINIFGNLERIDQIIFEPTQIRLTYKYKL